jgi:hypothetical protein
MDTFPHGSWQHFQALGLTENGLTGMKNILMECLVGAYFGILEQQFSVGSWLRSN